MILKCFIVGCFIATIFLRVDAQNINLNKHDILISSGISLAWMKSKELNTEIVRGDLLARGEYFVSDKFSLGLSLDYSFTIITDVSPYFEADYYTGLMSRLYTKGFTYFELGIIYHRQPDFSWINPNSFMEFGYTSGMGKLIKVSDRILFDFGGQIGFYKAKFLISSGEWHTRQSLKLKLYTGVRVILIINSNTLHYENSSIN